MGRGRRAGRSVVTLMLRRAASRPTISTQPSTRWAMSMCSKEKLIGPRLHPRQVVDVVHDTEEMLAALVDDAGISLPCGGIDPLLGVGGEQFGKPRMVLSGVRSSGSWRRGSGSLARFARSASVRARWSSSSCIFTAWMSRSGRGRGPRRPGRSAVPSTRNRGPSPRPRNAGAPRTRSRWRKAVGGRGEGREEGRPIGHQHAGRNRPCPSQASSGTWARAASACSSPSTSPPRPCRVTSARSTPIMERSSRSAARDRASGDGGQSGVMRPQPSSQPPSGRPVSESPSAAASSSPPPASAHMKASARARRRCWARPRPDHAATCGRDRIAPRPAAR